MPTGHLKISFNLLIVARFCSFNGDGYAETHCKMAYFLHPFFFKKFIANFKSLKFAKPFEIIIGLLVFATFFNKGICPISADAILYAGHLSFSKKSTAVSSNGVEKTGISICLHN